MKIRTLIAVLVLISANAATGRTWTSVDGRTIEGDYLRATAADVTVRKVGGKEVVIPLEKLSKEDQEFVKMTLAEANKPKPIAEGKYSSLVTGDWARDNFKKGLPFRFYASEKLDGSKTYPLVIYLHGKGSGGTDNEKQLSGLPKTFAKENNYKDRPCFIMVPQCPEDEFWSNSKALDDVVDLTKDLIKNLPIDAKRIYITGYSMGGYGTWAALAKEPKLFAAAVPVAGGGNPASVRKFKKVPVWCFHGDADDVVDVEESRRMVKALEKARGDIKYSEMAGGDHGIGGKVYNDTDLHKWLFQQAR